MKRSVVVALPLLAFAAGCAESAPHPSTAATFTQANLAGARPFHVNVVAEAQRSDAYRHVLFTGALSQLAMMTIPMGGDIGMESHAHVEQLIFVVSGTGKVVADGIERSLTAGDVVVATPNTRHNVINTTSEPLRIYTVYAPPNHIDGRVHRTKADAERDSADDAFGAAVR